MYSMLYLLSWAVLETFKEYSISWGEKAAINNIKISLSVSDTSLSINSTVPKQYVQYQTQILIQLGISQLCYCFPLGCISNIFNRYFNYLNFAGLSKFLSAFQTGETELHRTKGLISLQKGATFKVAHSFPQGKSILSATDLPTICFQIILQSYSLQVLPSHVTSNCFTGVCTHLLIWHYLSTALHRVHKKWHCGIKLFIPWDVNLGLSWHILLFEDLDNPESQPHGFSRSHTLEFARKNRPKPLQQSPQSKSWVCLPSAINLLPNPTEASWKLPCYFHLHQQFFCAQATQGKMPPFLAGLILNCTSKMVQNYCCLCCTS